MVFVSGILSSGLQRQSIPETNTFSHFEYCVHIYIYIKVIYIAIGNSILYKVQNTH